MNYRSIQGTSASVYFILFLLIGCNSGAQEVINELAKKAETLEDPSIKYVSSYQSIPYPMGDVEDGTGVCTDVVIRAFRMINIDLQKEVHEDMEENFEVYPNNWGLLSTDKNIDHRRVPNLMTYFDRQGWSIPITDEAMDYVPGDIVAWNLGNGLTHIGIVVHSVSNGRYLIMHNIGAGQVIEDILFDFEIIGHYRKK